MWTQLFAESKTLPTCHSQYVRDQSVGSDPKLNRRRKTRVEGRSRLTNVPEIIGTDSVRRPHLHTSSTTTTTARATTTATATTFYLSLTHLANHQFLPSIQHYFEDDWMLFANWNFQSNLGPTFFYSETLFEFVFKWKMVALGWPFSFFLPYSIIYPSVVPFLVSLLSLLLSLSLSLFTCLLSLLVFT